MKLATTEVYKKNLYLPYGQKQFTYCSGISWYGPRFCRLKLMVYCPSVRELCGPVRRKHRFMYRIYDEKTKAS